ncbi:MAG: DUF4268 domain-containing protein [Planctomycetota bacterium]
MLELSRLEQVELRHAWATEAGDFTPWLAQESNLNLLGDTVGIDLELEAQEKNVGPFRADILCQDTADDSWVLIENQLEKTDHIHLGQLMTYAAGLKAVTIIWIADRFTEEHRAALDWLNSITNSQFNFFGLEVELWKIANSPIAPKFNVVCKPNDWAKQIASAAKDSDNAAPSETRLLQLEYWQGLRQLLLDRKSEVKPQKPRLQHWTNFALGRSHFGMHASVNTQKNFLRIGVSCYEPDADAHFNLLLDQKTDIETEVGTQLDWDALPNRKECRIAIVREGIDPTDRSDWPQQHSWLVAMLERMHSAFSPRVKTLDASEWQPDTESDED